MAARASEQTTAKSAPDRSRAAGRRSWQITKRMPLYVGMRCNCACSFCYQLPLLRRPMRPTPSLLDELRRYRRLGIESIDFTGGEPTIHPDISTLVRQAVALGFRDLALITNGIALRDEPARLDQLLDAGIAIFHLSIHGHDATLHDRLTGRRGSFEAQLALLERLQRRQVAFGINLVVNTHNVRHLPTYAELMASYGPRHGVTFLVMNPMGQANERFATLTARHSEIAGPLREAIQLLRERDCAASWKFMPLCLLPDCIAESSNNSQFFLTPYDWNLPVCVLTRSGAWTFARAFFEHFGRFDRRQLTTVPLALLAYQTMIAETFDADYSKIDRCRGCKYVYVCDGQSTSYRELFGSDELQPILGEPIVNPLALTGDAQPLGRLEQLANRTIAALSRPAAGLLAKLR